MMAKKHKGTQDYLSKMEGMHLVEQWIQNFLRIEAINNKARSLAILS